MVGKDDGSLTPEEIAEKEAEGFLMIDGSVGEGGGQVLRISIALAAILQRSKPGMRAQHLEGIKLVGNLHQATIEGGELYSRILSFSPNPFLPQPGIIADPTTAGSICLLKQIVLPTLVFASAENIIELRGGTNASMAPQIDYAINVFGPMASILGVEFNVKIEKRGFFPKGGGIAKLTAIPKKVLQPITLLDRGNVTETYIRSFVARTDRKEAVKMFTSSSQKISSGIQGEIKEDIVIEKQCIGTAKGILCVTKTDTGCILGGSAISNSARDSPVRLGKFAADELLRTFETSACVDEYLQDQLIIFMALAKGKSQIRTGPLTEHTTTAILITSKFVGDIFKVHEQTDGSFIIECDGIGFQNRYLVDESE